MLRAGQPRVELFLLEFRKLCLELVLRADMSEHTEENAARGRTSSISTPVYVLVEIASETSFASCVCSWMSAIVASTLSIFLCQKYKLC